MPLKKPLHITWILILLLILLVLVFRNTNKSDDALIRDIIAAAEKAAEKHDLQGCLAHISNRYTDNLGNTRATLSLAIKEIFKEYSRIFIHISKLHIEVHGSHAEAKMIIIILASHPTEGEKVNLLPTRGSDRFSISFEKEEGNWKITRVELLPYKFD